MSVAYAGYAVLCLVGLGIRTAYEILKEHGRIDTRNTGIFLVVFAAMVLMLGSWILMCPLDPWRIEDHPALQGAGLVMLIVGLTLALAGLIHLRGLENIDHLVTTGPFAKIRHPMYMGFVLWILGWIVYYGAFMSLLIGILCIGNILYWRRLEESSLAASYGETYLAYSRGTWF